MKTRLTLHKSSLVVLLCATFIGACAGPQLQVPRASPQGVDLERQRQLGLIQDKKDLDFKSRMEEWRRVFAVYSRLRTAGVELCKADLKPFWGLWLADQSVFSNDDRDRAKRFLGIDQKVFILAASGLAANAGLRAGDVVSKIDGVIVEPQTWMSQGSFLQRASDVLAKADMRPVEIEISRSQGKYSVTLTPDVGCRYPLTILPDEQINAGATGNAIVIFSGILSVASTDDELAHVIAHELAHNALGHPGRSKSNEAVGGVIGAVIDIGVLLGTGVNTRGVFTQVGKGEGRKAYSQDFEREADYMSLYFMTRSGFDATKAADMQRKLGIVTPGNLYSNYTATHPSTPERAANLELAIQEVAGKVFRHEPLVPTQLATQNVTTQDAKIDAVNILQRQVKVEPKRQAPEQISALRPIVADRISSPARWSALLTHVKGRTIFSPPTVLQAEYLEIEEGRGSSRVVYPGNYILEGEFRIQPRDQNFKGVVASRLIDPDKFIAPFNSSQKGFASYSNADGTVMECSFSVSNDGSINQGTCLDNRGNQYRVSD